MNFSDIVKSVLSQPQAQTTPIPAGQEEAFQKWLLENAHILEIAKGIGTSDYDYAGAYMAGLNRDAQGGQHFPDAFKKTNHPTFSNESFNPNQNPAGSWVGENFLPDIQALLRSAR